MAKAPFSISRSADALAHGTSRWLCDVTPVKKLAREVKKMRVLPRRISTKKIESIIPQELQKYLITKHVKRPNGDRVNALWTFLAPFDDYFSVCELRVDKDFFGFGQTGIRLSHHCFARVMQRTSSTSDVATTVGFLKSHLLGLMLKMHEKNQTNGRVPDGSEVVVYTQLGKLILEAQTGFLMGKTWIDAYEFHQEDRDEVAALSLKGDICLWWDEPD